MDPLSDRHQRTLGYIRASIAGSGRSPSLREICGACGISSLSLAQRTVKDLAAMGYIGLGTDGTQRSICIPGARTILPGSPVTVRTPGGELVTGELVGAEAGA